MSISAEVIKIHIDYTAWASERILRAAGTLSPEELHRDFGTSDKSVLGTLTHVYRSDLIWLARLKGSPVPPFQPAEPLSFETMEREWLQLLTEWREFAAGLTQAQLERPVTYTDLKGNQWTQPLWQPMLHVVNHGTHHRGQVAGFLRALGHTPPPLDLTLYHRALGSVGKQVG